MKSSNLLFILAVIYMTLSFLVEDDKYILYTIASYILTTGVVICHTVEEQFNKLNSKLKGDK